MSLNLLQDLIQQAELDFSQAYDIHTLESKRAVFLGKNGYINQHLKILHTLSSHKKAKLGLTINQVKKNIHNLFVERKKTLKSKILENSLHTDLLDVTLPGKWIKTGNNHPITNVIKRAKYFFQCLGFTEIHGPEIEEDYFNFDALNIPVNHPSRDEHDTFWLNSNNLLRTHTSGIQIRTMMNTKPPIRIISIGKVYRKDYDKNHSPMFHQIEGLMVDININFSNLKKILYDFLYNFFEQDITLRFRPSYFPFTEPSAEIDILNKKLQHYKHWLELLGCGMIHPTVLHNVGINSKEFSGFAFGIGIERLAMLLYNIDDIRTFFKNDLEFLNQF